MDRIRLLQIVGVAIVGLIVVLAVMGVREAYPLLSSQSKVVEWIVEGGEVFREGNNIILSFIDEKVKASADVQLPLFTLAAFFRFLDEGRDVKAYFIEVDGNLLNLSSGSWSLREEVVDISSLSYRGGRVTLVKEGGFVVLRDPVLMITQLQPLPLLMLVFGCFLAIYGLILWLIGSRTVATDLSCGNLGRIKMKGPLEQTLKLLGFHSDYDRPKPRADSLHVITSGDTVGFPKSYRWLRFLYIIIPDRPPRHEIPSWMAGSSLWRRMSKRYSPPDRAGRAEAGDAKKPSSPAGRRADIVREQVLNPYVYNMVRLGIQRRAPTVSKYVNAEGCLETGTAAGVFSLAASELFARVQRRQLTTVTILSEPVRLLNEGSDRERYISNAMLFVRDGRAVFQQVDAVIYMEQEEEERAKMDKFVGEFKALMYTASADSLFGDIGNMRSVAGYTKLLVPVKLRVTRVADSVSVDVEHVPLKTLSQLRIDGKPMFLLATVPPEHGAARLMDELLQAIAQLTHPTYIESCFIVAPIASPIAYILVPLSYEEIDNTALGFAIKSSGFAGSEEYFTAQEARQEVYREAEQGLRVEGGIIKLR
jgi:hypothetical protein